jgi:hypothetical protein
MKKLLLLLCLPVMMSAQIFIDSLSFIRPANPTAYANGDIVCAVVDSGVLSFTGFKAHRTGVILGGSVSVDTASTAGSFRLWLFSDTTGFSKIGDNAAWVAPVNMISKLLVGYIDFSLTSTGLGAGSAGSADAVSNVNLPYIDRGRGLFGILTAAGAYTPKHSGRITVKIYGYGMR